MLDLLSGSVTLFQMSRRPTRQEVEVAEKLLGVRLPPSFNEYYAKSKWHAAPFMNLCSVVPLFEHQPSIAEVNFHMRVKQENKYPLPTFLICFDVSAGIDDDYACFDSRQPDDSGEYPVVYWSSEDGDYYESVEPGTGRTCVVDDLRSIAPNFSSYLYDILKRRIADEEEAKRKKAVHKKLPEREKIK
ncbi:MAG: SMI1/KNR4 family protein [Nitrospiraceae bacterium]|nr:SMI1/KNR4 family protein [Nitrospiraceae bacterium]